MYIFVGIARQALASDASGESSYTKSTGVPRKRIYMNHTPGILDSSRLFLSVPVAQLVEHRPFKAGVLGSSPSRDTKARTAIITSRMIKRLRYFPQKKSMPVRIRLPDTSNLAPSFILGIRLIGRTTDFDSVSVGSSPASPAMCP